MGHLPAAGVLLSRLQGAPRRSGGTANRSLLALVLSALVALLVGLVGGCGSGDRPTAPPVTTFTPGLSPQPSGSAADDGMPTVAYADLPPEAHHTLALIDRGGPFPYRQDGSVFANREGLLPPEPHGYYREYTVLTPGSPDRGARRIVAARDGPLYYTDDHYQSFARIER